MVFALEGFHKSVENLISIFFFEENVNFNAINFREFHFDLFRGEEISANRLIFINFAEFVFAN